MGGWGRGFVLAVSEKWREPESVYRFDRPGLGSVQFVQVGSIWVANMIAQRGYTKGAPALCLQSLICCLESVKTFSERLNLTIHMPKIGTGLGGRRWSEVEPLIKKHLGDNVVVHDPNLHVEGGKP